MLVFTITTTKCCFNDSNKISYTLYEHFEVHSESQVNDGQLNKSLPMNDLRENKSPHCGKLNY